MVGAWNKGCARKSSGHSKALRGGDVVGRSSDARKSSGSVSGNTEQQASAQDFAFREYGTNLPRCQSRHRKPLVWRALSAPRVSIVKAISRAVRPATIRGYFPQQSLPAYPADDEAVLASHRLSPVLASLRYSAHGSCALKYSYLVQLRDHSSCGLPVRRKYAKKSKNVRVIAM